MIAAWSLVHGFATLCLDGNIPTDLGPPRLLARRIARALDAQSGVDLAEDTGVKHRRALIVAGSRAAFVGEAVERGVRNPVGPHEFD